MNSNSNPTISVVMPVYNGEEYLCEAIDSILNQTYTDFEFIILNDGSTDKTEEIILSYSDPRIVYVKNDVNLQITKTLNRGIALARGRYIARMDADDISLSTRFEKQVRFLEDNPNVDVCGTWVEIFGSRKERWEYPIEHEEIKAMLLFNSALAHPSIMMKKSIFKTTQYDEKYNKAQDYALWVSLLRICTFHNIPEFLLKYRLHDKQTKKTIQNNFTNKIRNNMLKKIGCSFSDERMKNYIDIASYKFVKVSECEEILYEILIANQKTKVIQQDRLENFLGRRFLENINSCKKYSLKMFYEYGRSSVRKYVEVSWLRDVKLFIKCLIGYSNARK